MPHKSMPYLQKARVMFVGHLSLLLKTEGFDDLWASTEIPLLIPLQNQHPKLYPPRREQETEIKRQKVKEIIEKQNIPYGKNENYKSQSNHSRNYKNL